MKKTLSIILFLLCTGLAFSQTTVTLQDQCNCEVLSGTDVSAPGVTSPTGADVGDIYVNTNTGAIFFWDGDSWELTSGTDTNTTNASLSEDGVNLILTDSDSNTVSIPLADIAAIVDTNTTNVSFTINTGSGQLEITDSDSNTLFVSLTDLAAAIDMDDQDLTGASLDGSSVLQIDIEDGASTTVDLSALEESADIAANATDIATNATDIANHVAADGDLDAANELNTGFAVNGGDLEITDAGGTLSVALSSIGSDDQDLTGASLDGSSVLQIDIEDGTSTTVDLSALEESAAIAANAADIATNATDISNNATDIANHVAADGDLDAANELNTGFAVNGGDLEITDAGGTLSVALSSIGSDDQDLTGASLDGSSVLQIDIEDGTSTTVDLSALEESAAIAANATDIATNTTDIATNTTNIATNATDIANHVAADGDLDAANELNTGFAVNGGDLEITDAGGTLSVALSSIGSDDQDLTGASLDGSSVLQIDIEDGTSTTVDLSALEESADIAANATDIATNTTDIATNTTNIATNATDIANHVAADGDLDAANELNTGFAVNGGDLEITDAGGTLSVALSSIGSDDQDLTGASLDGSSVLQIDIEDGTSTTVDLSALEESADIAANATDIATNTTDIATNTTNIATNATDIANHVAADGDLDAANELNTGFAVNGGDLEITDAGGTLSVALSSIGSDDQDLTGASLDGSSVLQIDIEDGASTTVDLSALEESADIAANAADIATNATDIATNTTDIAANTTNIATNATDIANHVAADGDLDAGNELNTGFAVNGGDLEITDAGGTLSVALSSIGSDDQDLTGASLDGSSVLQIDIEDGASTTVDLSALEESADIAANAADIAANATDIATNTTDIATNTTNIATNATDIANHVAADGDLDAANELNTGFAVNGGDLEITDAGGTLSVALSSIGSDDQDLTGASLDGSSVLQIDIEDGTSTTVDLSALEESADIAANAADIATNATDIATNTTDIAANTTNIATNATDIANHVAADGDLDAANELNTGFAVNGGDLEITDAGGTLSVALSSIGSDDQDLTGASLDGSSVLQIDIEDGASTTVDLSALEESADIAANAADIAANATDIATNTTDIATNTTNIATNATDIANHVAADGDLDAANELNTGFAVNGGDLEITDAGGTLSVALSSIGSDDQDLTGASLDGSSVLQIDIEDGASTTVDLSALEESADIAANATDIAANTTNIATNATDIANHIAADADTNVGNEYNTTFAINGSDLELTDGGGTLSVDLGALAAATDTDDQDLTGSSLDGSSVLQIDIEDGASTTVDLSALEESADIAANATDIATNATDIANHVAADGDLDAANELNTGFAVNGGDLEITDAGGTLSVALSSIGSDDQDLTGASLDGSSVLQIDIEDGTSTTVDLSALEESADIAANAADIATNATDISNNATDIANHVAADGDLDAGNELNTGFAVNGGDLEITDAGGTLSVALSSIGSDDQDLTGASLDGSSVLQIDIEDGTSTTVDLSALEESAAIAANATDIAMNTTDIATNTTNIATNATDIANHVAADGDLDAANELNTGFAVNGGDLEITDAGGTLSVALSSIGSDDQDLTGASLDGSSVLQIDIEDGTSTTVDLSALEESADIAANATDIATNTTDIATNTTNIATNATDIANHVAADGDLDAANELNTGFAVNGGDLEITDAGGTLSVALSSIGSDDQDLTGASLDGSSVLQIDIEDGASTTVDLSALEESADIAANAADIATNATDIATNTTDIAANTTNIATNATDIANHVAADGDLDAGNELNTGFAVNGGDLEITDAGGTLSVALSSIGSDDQDLTGASLDGSSVLQIDIEDGASTTVDLSALEESADIAANAADIATNATDIATNTTDIAANTTNIATNATDIANHVAADGDLDAANELNTGFAVNGGDLEITDAGGTLSVALSSIGSDDQDLTGASLDGSSVLQIDIEDGASTTVDLSALEESADIAANATDIAANTTNIATNATDIANHIAADADTNVGNEYNTTFAINGSDLELTDGGGTLSVDLGALAAATDTDDQDLTGASLDGSSVLQIDIEDGASTTVDLSALEESADIAANATDIATNATDIANHVAADGDLDAANELNTGFAVNGGDLEITDAGGTLSVALSSIGSDDQDLTGASLDGSSVLQIDIEDGTSTTVDLSALEESAAIAANAADIATNATDISNNATDIANHVAADGDLDAANELNTGFAVNGGDLEITDAGGTLSVALSSIGSDDQDLTGASLDGSSVLQIDIEDGTSTTVDLSALEESAAIAANATDIATNTTDIATNTTNIATNATDIANHVAADGDLDAANELNTGFAVNGGDLEITDAGGTLSVALSSIGSDDQDLTGASLDGSSVLQIDIEDGTSTTVDLSALEESADIAANATDIATNTTDIATNTTNIATNATDIANHVAADGDLDAANELNTGFAVNGGDLEITDAGGTLSVALSSIGSDDQDLTGASLDGSSVLQIDIEDGASTTVDLSALEESADIAANAADIATNATDIATNTTDIAANTTNIATNATDIANHVAADGDLDAGNELNTGFAVNGGDLEITDAGGTLSVALSSIGSDDQDLTGASLDGSSVLQIDIEDGASTTVDLSALEESADIAANAADIATNATDIATNTTDIAANTTNIATNATDIANHVAADGDLDAANELNTGFAVNGGDLEITDAGGTLSVALSSIGSDDQDLTGASLDGSSVLQIDIEDGTSTTVDLSALEESADIAANATDIATNTTDIATNTTNIATNATDIANHVAADGDLDAANELNTGFAVNGGDLEITDAGGTLSVALSSIGSDDQDLTGASLDGSSVLQIDIEDGTSTTVDLSALEESADIAANAADIATNATDIATNTTDIATNTTNIATNATDIANHVAADGDLDAGNELNTGFAVNGGDLEITDAGGTLSVALSSIGSDDQDLTGASLDGSSVLQIDIEDGASTTVDLSDLDDDITITNTVTGNRIATIAQDGGSSTDINETVTELSQDTSTGEITFTKEDGTDDAANVVGAESDNMITAGANGGAYLAAMPTIYAAGKVSGNGTAAAIYGATVSRTSEGDYDVTFTTALSNANYIIQLTTLDCGGDCPGNTTQNYDDPGITYYSQGTGGFSINIGDSDNGTTAKDDIDLEFMFTVIVLPN